MYTPPPKVDFSLGLTAADFPAQVVEVWPENWPTVCLFDALSTQWRMGPSGCYGLDYGVLPFVMRVHGVRGSDRAAVFDDLRVMEIAALETMRANSG